MTSQKEKKRSGSPPPVPIESLAVAAKRRILLAGGRRPTATTTPWESTPVPILILIFHYLDQLGLMQASSVSNHWHQIIDVNPGMAEHRIIPVLKINASQNTEDLGRSVRQLEFLQANINKLQRYQLLEVHDVNKFDNPYPVEGPPRFQLNGIVSLDVSSPSKVSGVNYGFLYQLSSWLPNLRELNLSNIGGEELDEVLNNVSTRCRQLERIVWNNIDTECDIYMTGLDMMKATNLREIIMDESIFTYVTFGDDDTIVTISDLENHPHSFLFRYCTSPVLERVSIRHAKYGFSGHKISPMKLPQNALIKYIRKAPRSLRWFRSDLSAENIKMLQLERPGIQFVN